MSEVDVIAGMSALKKCTLRIVHQFAPFRCIFRTVYYWFRFPTGWCVSGHAFEEQPDGRLVCRDCGKVSD